MPRILLLKKELLKSPLKWASTIPAILPAPLKNRPAFPQAFSAKRQDNHTFLQDSAGFLTFLLLI